ncbi:hypothetical protein RB195_005063 [Necator americanus]|uniref:Uncharacterized protein n=1 Tax=Necator americanus TaxID=51031 RepID=A0ABR1BL15_NECAM
MKAVRNACYIVPEECDPESSTPWCGCSITDDSPLVSEEAREPLEVEQNHITSAFFGGLNMSMLKIPSLLQSFSVSMQIRTWT